MKKFVVTILAVLYLGASTGATLHLHYCMGKLVGTQLWHNDSKKCSKCGMSKASRPLKDCCKDEHKLVKVDSDHLVAGSVLQWLLPAEAILPVGISIAQPSLRPLLAVDFPVGNAPPGSGTIPLFIQHRRFLI